MTDILTLATALRQPGEILDSEHRLYPRVDYVELQRLLDLDLIDYASYPSGRRGRFLRWIETQLRFDPYLLFLGAAGGRDRRLVVCLSERVGIPFAALNRLSRNRRRLVSVFTSWSARQETAITRLGLFKAMDRIVVMCRAMKEHLVRLGAAADQIEVLSFGVDHRFFAPVDEGVRSTLVLSAGEVRNRDYPTFLRAAEGLASEIVLLPSGLPFAREKKRGLTGGLPGNVTVLGPESPAELKRLYARAAVVVVPLHDRFFPAGLTTLLEAMSMARPAVVTRSRGIADYVIGGETAILVEPGDARGMREAISHLVAYPEEARRLGENARRRVEAELNQGRYVHRLAELLRTACRQSARCEPGPQAADRPESRE